MISRKNKFLFVHIPKTAGNSITKALQEFSDIQLTAAPSPSGISNGDNFWVTDKFFGSIKHWSLAQFENALKDDIESYISFSCVRNPWDRLVSAYFFFKQAGVELDSRAKKLGVPSDVFNPEEFRLMIESDSMDIRKILRPQVEFLASNRSTKVQLIRYENLDNDFNSVIKTIGLPEIKLPLLNKSKRSEHKAVLDKNSSDLVRDNYHSDITSFNYDY